jgi:Ca-activated chloride channel family protein
MRKIIVLCLLIAAIAAGSLMQISDRIGRRLLSAGFPNVAAALMTDPGWKGIAYYSAHKWEQAAEAFRQSHSPEANYDLGNALAQARQYIAAIDAYDAALAWNPDDIDAQTNKQILERLTNSESEISGQGAAAGLRPKEGTVANSGLGQSSNSGSDQGSSGGGGDNGQSRQLTLLENNARIGPKTDASSSNPDLQWLEALPDKAQAFLKLRIEAEHERRVEAGLSPSASNQRE